MLIGVMVLLCGGCFGIAGMVSESTAQGEYILVHVSVTNIGDRPQTYFGSNQKLFDDQGKQFENDTRAEINLHDHMATTINPGNTSMSRSPSTFRSGRCQTSCNYTTRCSPAERKSLYAERIGRLLSNTEPTDADRCGMSC